MAFARRIDLLGQRFGRLVVIAFFDTDRTRVRWLCRCECGNEVVAPSGALRRGSKQSCGCLLPFVNGVLNRTHGQGHSKERTPEYTAWGGMRDRCLNPNNHAYKSYGGRGITICGRWRDGDGERSGFECFFADMGPKPTRRHSLDRFPNTDGNYEPDNCRWATPKEQMRNRRVSVMVDYQGSQHTLAELCEKANIKYGVAYNRIRAGKSVEDALRPVVRRAA